MEQINSLTSDIEDLRDAMKGFHGTEIGTDYKITYLGKCVIANGEKEVITNKLKVPVYELISVGNKVYIGWIKI